MPPDGKPSEWELTRRRLVASLGGTGVVGLAGCASQEDEEGGPNQTDTSVDTSTATPTDSPTDVSEVEMGGELVATFGADVKNFDPTKINDTTSSKAFGLVYETLMATDWNGKPQPYLAESVEQQGDLAFEVTLREGVTFHDGNSLTAEDVKTTLERYKGTPRESDVYDWYESSTVVDERTIDLKLSRRYAPLKFSLGGVPIVPKEVESGDLELKENPIGTGPYTFDEHQPDKLFRITRNEDYWWTGGDLPEKPPIETVTFRVITEQSAQLAALQGGDVDFINDPPASNVEKLKNNDSFTVDDRIAGGFDMFIYPMHEKADTPWQNRNVRIGTNRLVPREAIVETVYNGIGQPAYAPVSPLAQQFTSEEFQQEMADKYAAYDEQKANEMLQKGFDEAGFSKPFKSTIITNQNPQRVKWCQLIQESLNSTEFFDISLDQFEWNTYVGKILSEDAHAKNNIVAVGWSAGWDPDAYVHNLFHSKQFTPNCCNINHYERPEIDDLIERGLETYDLAERTKIYEQLQRKIVEESPMAFIRFGKAHGVWRSDAVSGFQTYPIDGAEYASIYAPYAGAFTWMTG